MINVTFTGNIFHSNGNPAQNVRYQGLFIKVNNNSSNTIWDNTRLSETNQYNFNLGDNTWLSQQSGYASPNDKVVLCFWIDNTSDRTDTDLIEWCFIEWILDGRDVYNQNIQLMGHNHPTCSFSLSGAPSNQTSYLIDIGSTDNSDWIYEGKEHYQSYQWDNNIIYPMNRLPDNSVVIDWGDTAIDGPLPLSGSPFPHTYTVAGGYDVNVDITNTETLKCSASYHTDVRYEVINGLDWIDPVRLNQSITFDPDIGGSIVSISGVDYYIDGDLVHQNLTYNQSFDHTFTSNGNHQVKQCIKFNDGIDNQIQCKDFIVNMDTLAGFTSSDYDCGLVFVDTSIIGGPPVVKYQWDVTDGIFILAHVEGTEYDNWYYNWPYRGTFHVRLAVTDSNGKTSSITKEYIVDECIGGNSEGGSGGGGGSSPWIYQETNYRGHDKPIPVLHITKMDDCDTEAEKDQKRILLLEITDDSIV